jgi:ubiquinone/menaquinone biosynthesis C-methylase UbiE
MAASDEERSMSTPVPEDVARAQATWQGRDTSSAEAYERYAVPAVFGPWAHDLVALAALRPGERVLDVACGTGVVTRLAAEQVGASGRVVGLDFSPGMLQVARTVPPPAGAAITWQEGSAEALPFGESSFDVVLCQHGLPFVADRPRALAEMRRVLVSGGRLAIAVWQGRDQNPVDAILAEALVRFGAHGQASRQLVAHALGDAETLRTLVASAGLCDVTIRSVTKLHRYPSAELFLQRRLVAPELDAATVARMHAEVRDALRPYAEGEGLVFPMAAHLLTAQA